MMASASLVESASASYAPLIHEAKVSKALSLSTQLKDIGSS